MLQLKLVATTAYSGQAPGTLAILNFLRHWSCSSGSASTLHTIFADAGARTILGQRYEYRLFHDQGPLELLSGS